MAKDSSARRIYGLIGYPVKHSLSPAMHNVAFGALNINAEYRLFPLRENELNDFFAGLKINNIFGLNVTIPYKEKVIPFIAEVSSEARLIGAVNTIRVLADKLEGFNTDGEGFLRHLNQDLNFNPEGKGVAIIGAGGAAKAVSVYLSKAKPKSVAVYDVDKSKSLALVNHLKDNFSGVEFIFAESIEELNIGTNELLVNATPIGMKEADPCLVDEKFIHEGLLVYDLIYNPKETKLLKLARQKGAKTSNGLGMLLYQGVRAFELWTDTKAPVEIMRKVLTEAMDK